MSDRLLVAPDGVDEEPARPEVLAHEVAPDHVHMMLSIPPKFAVSQVVGFIKGKSAIHLARVYAERKPASITRSRRSFERGFVMRAGLLRQPQA